ncbi:MAG: NADH-quinone oxidoreductase subunit L [Bacteroidetes bacterium]|nr:NADH-quinone oxidoreductase subunit L [Bacteroidota bacterium]
MEFALQKLPLVVLLIPMFSFLVLAFFGNKLPRGGDWLATTLLFLNLALSGFILFVFGMTGRYELNLEWFNLGNNSFFGMQKFFAGFQIDALTAVMLVVVNAISSFVHLFSVKYMEGDAKYKKYFSYLGLFTFSMLGLVLTNNILLMYVFWELVGLCSYLLIGFWYENKAPQEAAKKAFIVNRVGDVGFFLGISVLFLTIGSLTFSDIFAGVEAGKLAGGTLTAAGILLFCGAVGKSAQFPLHVWLPDAMEGPTPVSALIHAATMVAAGVYLVARIFVILSADALTVITFIGVITAFISATIALTQNDIKKVLAYSTISQLGYMIMAIGVGAYSFGFFHLVTHAFFKACLFLTAGSVIYGMHHVQDIREMGGLRKKMPITFYTFLMATLAISGVPLTSGFLSKDAILASTLAFADINGGITILVPILAFGVAGLTAFYMFRLLIITFLGEPKNKEKYEHCHESPVQMTLPLILLAVLSFFGFFSLNPLSADHGWFLTMVKMPESLLAGTQGAMYHILPLEEFEEHLHHAHGTAMILSLVISGLGILTAYLFYYWEKINADKLAEAIKPLYNFSLNKWYFDELYDKTAVAFTMGISKLSGWIDAKIVDGIVNGSATFTRGISKYSGLFDNIFVDGIVNLTGGLVGAFGLIFRKFQTGKIQTYIAFLVFGIIVLYFVFRVF